jgi:hypothetical protein
MAEINRTARAPVVTPIPIAAVVGRPFAGADVDVGDDVLDKSTVGTVETVRVVGLFEKIVVAGIGVEIAYDGGVGLSNAVLTVEKAESLISPSLTNEKAWPGWGWVKFVLRLALLGSSKSRWYVVPLTVVLK